MSLIRWNGGSDLLNLHGELDRVFEALSAPLSAPLLAHYGAAQTYLPLDIRRVDDHIEVQASVPGYKPEDVTVTVDAGVITINAEEKSEKQDAADGFCVGSATGAAYSAGWCWDGVDGDKATAAFADGVLTVKVPMVARPEPKRIAIQSGTTKAGKILDGDSTA